MSDETYPRQPDILGNHHCENPNSPLASQASMRWQTLWPQIIAECWTNQEWRDELLTADAEKTRDMIQHKYSYRLPDSLQLTFYQSVAHDDSWFARNEFGEPEIDCAQLPPNILRMPIPTAPKEPNDWAVAITAYANVGRTYPFTCVCW